MEVFLLSALLFLFLVCAVLIAQLFRLERKNRLELFQLREQSFKAVQQPHFLSNGLAAIRDSYHTHGPNAGDQYVALFARFMRQTLNLSRESSISIQEEVAFLDEYLRLHQLRLPDLQWEISIHNLLHEDRIPPMLIQPLVENSLKHARPKGALSLRISLKKQAGEVVIQVTDNGQCLSIPALITPDASRRQGTTLIRQRLLSYQEFADLPITFFCQHQPTGHTANISFPQSITLNTLPHATTN